MSSRLPVVGIDIGGTKTHVRARGVDGEERDLVVPSGLWRKGGLFGDVGNSARLLSLVEEVLPEGSAAATAALAVGAHGCDTAEACVALAARLRELRPGPVEVVNDAALLVAAVGREAGVAVIAGTGAIVVAVFPDRSPLTIGGHGWLFGDEASAPGIVREAVKRVLDHRDAGESRELLGDHLVSHFAVADETELIYRLGDDPSITDWASGAPGVFGAADEGSMLALQAIEDAATALAADVATAGRRGANTDMLVCGGGVMTNQPRLFALVRNGIRERLPHAEVILLTEPPVEGAVVRAVRLAACI